jgi:hypothetical protein
LVYDQSLLAGGVLLLRPKSSAGNCEMRMTDHDIHETFPSIAQCGRPRVIICTCTRAYAQALELAPMMIMNRASPSQLIMIRENYE